MKIGKDDLSSELLRLLLAGNGTVDTATLNKFANDITNLENSKQDIQAMSNYINKTTDKISESEFDSNFAAKIKALVDKKINYNDLEIALQNRICNYEDNATRALNKATSLESMVNSLNTIKSVMQNDISILYGLAKNGSSEAAEQQQMQI